MGREISVTAKSAAGAAVVFDPSPLFLDVLTRLLEKLGIDVRAGTTQPLSALDSIEEHGSNLLIVGFDAESTCSDVLSFIRDATARFRNLKVIALAQGRGSDCVDEVFAAGAAAYVAQDATLEDMAVAIRQSFHHSIHLAPDRESARPNRAAEEAGLTDREAEVLRLVSDGHSNAELARMLWVTQQTVKFHLSNIYRKLSVSNRTQASRWAQRAGLGEAQGDSTFIGVR